MANIHKKPIGERIIFSKDKQRLHVEISQKTEPWKETLLAVWTLAIAFCAVMMAYFSLAEAETDGQKIVLIVLFGLLTFIVLRVGKVWLWRRSGREIIHIANGRITVKNAFGERGRTDDLKASEVKQLTLQSHSDRNFFQFMDNSFWSLGGERIHFKYAGKQHRIGKQLNDSDAKSLLRVLQTGLKDFGKVKD